MFVAAIVLGHISCLVQEKKLKLLNFRDEHVFPFLTSQLFCQEVFFPQKDDYDTLTKTLVPCPAHVR